MAARARVRFSTSGAGKVTGAFGKVGGAAGSAGGKVGKFGTSTGSIFYKVMRNVGRLTMFSAGIQKMGKSATGAKKDIKGFADGSVTALSGLSKKFSELRRQYYFFKFTGQKLAAPFVWAFGEKKGGAEKTRAEEPKERPSRWLDRVEASAETSAVKIAVATTAWQKFLAVLGGGGRKIVSVAKKIFNLKNIIMVLVVAFTAVAAAGGAAFVYIGYKTAQFAKRMVVDFMSIREAFRQYEISLGGIIRNTYALGKMMKFATKYAAEYPAMFEEVLDTFRSLAALPALKPMFRRADEKDLKNIMNIIQGLATLDPIQGVKGAGIALREALSGDMRSIRRRFEISAHAIAEAGGYTLNEITKDSQKALKAFGEFIKLNVPAKSMADAAMTIGIQIGNLRDKYRSFVNDMMKSTGAYWSVVTAISGLNDWLTKVFASPIVKKWAAEAGNNIRAFVQTLESTLSKINWKKYIDSGDLTTGLVEGATRIAVFLRVTAEKWSAPFLEAVTRISKILWGGLIPIIKTIMKTIGIIFWEGAKAAVSSFGKSIAEGLSSGTIFKDTALFIYDTMVSIGKIAGKGFMLAFVGGLAVTGTVFGKIASTIRGTADAMEAEGFSAAKGYHKIADIFQTAADYWSKAPEIGKALEVDSSGRASEIKKSKDALAEYRKELSDTFDIKKKEKAPEIVTPELEVKEHVWVVKNLKEQLTAYKTIGASKEKLKAITNALAEAEKNLARATALKKWRKTGGKEQEEAQKKMDEYDKAILKASKSGKQLGAEFYAKKFDLQEELDALAEMYDRTIDQKSAWADLVSMVKAAPDSLKDWLEGYKIAKKDAGALLLVVGKLNDIISGKTVVKRDVFLDLLKKRIELTDAATKKEKKYKKELAKIPRSIAKNLAGLAGNLQSSVLSFVDKLQGAFIGIAKYGGEEPEPTAPIIGVPARRKTRKTREDRYEEIRQKTQKARIEGREWDFRRMVMEKIGDIAMVPKSMFGMGRAGMTYREGLGAGEGKKIPPYISYILQGIQKAVVEKKGPGEFPGGRKALAEMRMALLEKAIPFTKYRSEERAGLYAKMAGAQTDLMKATMETVRADIKMQRDQLTELQKQTVNTKLALSKSDTVARWLESIATNIRGIGSSNRVPQTSTIPSSQIGNSKITQSNPKTVTFEQGGILWEAMEAR